MRSAAPSGPSARAGASSSRGSTGQLEARNEQVVLGAEVVVHQRRVDSGVGGDRPDRRTPEAAVGEQAARAASRMSARVSGAPGPTSPGLLVMPGSVAPAPAGSCEVQLAEGQRLEEVGLARLAVAGLAGVDLGHDVPLEAAWSPAARGTGRTAGCRDPAPGARPWPTRCRRSCARGAAGSPVRSAISIGSELRGGGVREVDGGVGVGLLARGPTRVGRPSSRGARSPATDTCSRRRRRCRYDARGRRCPRRSRRRSRAATGTAGVRRPRRRRAPAAISALFSSLTHGSVPHTRWVISRHGAWIAHTGTWW